MNSLLLNIFFKQLTFDLTRALILKHGLALKKLYWFVLKCTIKKLWLSKGKWGSMR